MLDIKSFINKFIWTLGWNQSLFLTKKKKKYSNSYLIEWMQNFILPISSSGSYVYCVCVCVCVCVYIHTIQMHNSVCVCICVCVCVCVSMYIPCDSVIKNPPAIVGDTWDSNSVSGLVRSPGEGNGNQLQYSFLQNPVDRGAWWATVSWIAKSRTWISTHALCTIYICIHTHISQRYWFSSRPLQ